MAREGGSGDFLAGFILGGLVGGALALLFAPTTGEEMRGQIREKGIELRNLAEDLDLETLKAKGRAVVGEQRARFQEAIEEGKQAAARKKEELLERLESSGSSDRPIDLTGLKASS
ncbi:MAG TPA: YtxH domain-containing protein [Anaerolineae bacterium]|nr:YtxH domain-containing protein [Anaerolineae bacterium]